MTRIPCVAADCIVDIGPGAGEHGGKLVAIGTAEDTDAESEKSVTGAYLSGSIQDSGADGDANSRQDGLQSAGQQRIISSILMWISHWVL